MKYTFLVGFFVLLFYSITATTVFNDAIIKDKTDFYANDTITFVIKGENVDGKVIGRVELLDKKYSKIAFVSAKRFSFEPPVDGTYKVSFVLDDKILKSEIIEILGIKIIPSKENYVVNEEIVLRAINTKNAPVKGYFTIEEHGIFNADDEGRIGFIATKPGKFKVEFNIRKASAYSTINIIESSYPNIFVSILEIIFGKELTSNLFLLLFFLIILIITALAAFFTLKQLLLFFYPNYIRITYVAVVISFIIPFLVARFFPTNISVGVIFIELIIILACYNWINHLKQKELIK